MGKIALGEQRFEDAMKYYKLSYHAKGYSEAFWAIRLQWIQQYLVWSLLILAAVYFLIRLLMKKVVAYSSRRAWSPQMRQYAGEMKDAWYLIRYEHKQPSCCRYPLTSYVVLHTIR